MRFSIEGTLFWAASVFCENGERAAEYGYVCVKKDPDNGVVAIGLNKESVFLAKDTRGDMDGGEAILVPVPREVAVKARKKVGIVTSSTKIEYTDGKLVVTQGGEPLAVADVVPGDVQRFPAVADYFRRDALSEHLDSGQDTIRGPEPVGFSEELLARIQAIQSVANHTNIPGYAEGGAVQIRLPEVRGCPVLLRFARWHNWNLVAVKRNLFCGGGKHDWATDRWVQDATGA